MGCMIGGATGVLLGGFSALRMGLRGKELLIQVRVYISILYYKVCNKFGLIKS